MKPTACLIALTSLLAGNAACVAGDDVPEPTAASPADDLDRIDVEVRDQQPEAARFAAQLACGERLIAAVDRRFDETGRRVLRGKVLDLASATVRELTLDAASGEEVSYGELRDAEHARLAPRWAALLAAEAAAPAVRENLALGVARDIGQEALAIDHRVGGGSGVRVAIWEKNACVRRTHRDFASVTWEARVGGSSCNVSNEGGHSTNVAGVLAADRGGNDTAGLYHARFFDVATDIGSTQNVDAMFARNPTLVNASYTITVNDGLVIDQKVYDKKAFVFNGSGNDANDTANCYAYNALCVGAYNHALTYRTFSDDSANLAASYRNYAPDGGARNLARETPQLVGPWSVERLASKGHDSQYAANQGTSFATPTITGLAGLLYVRYPWALAARPSLMRAVLMASAQAHPIPGQRRIPDPDDSVDDRVGVGAPDGFRADAIMASASYLYRLLTPSTIGMIKEISLPASKRVRLVLAWDQCPGWNRFDPELNADLDMVVETPAQAFLYNVSHVDNHEVVEFVTSQAGTYRVHISAPTWSTCAQEGGQKRVRASLAWTLESYGVVSIGF